MIQTRHNNLNTGTINLSETKEKLLKTYLMNMVLLQKQRQMDYIVKTLDSG